MPGTTNMDSLTALNLLLDPRAIRFQMVHYQVLLHHWTKDWVKE